MSECSVAIFFIILAFMHLSIQAFAHSLKFTTFELSKKSILQYFNPKTHDDRPKK